MPEDESIYDEEGREEQVEDDEISAEEEGFMQGYESADMEKREKKEKRE